MRAIVVGIDLQDLLVNRDRVVAPALILAQRGEVKQSEFGLRIEIERLVVVALGRGVVARRQHRAPGVVVAQERLRIERDQLLENLAAWLILPALGVQRAQEQVGLLVLGRELRSHPCSAARRSCRRPVRSRYRPRAAAHARSWDRA